MLLTCKLCEKEFVTEKRRNRCGSCDTKIRRTRNKLAAIKLLGGECKICGFKKYYEALEFHHHNDDKKFTVGEIMNRSWDIVKCEVLKCDLICSNCHRHKHSTRYSYKIIEEAKKYQGKNADLV